MLRPSPKIDDVGEVHGVLAADEAAVEESRGAQSHDQTVVMRLVHEVEDACLQAGKGLLGDCGLILFGLMSRYL